MQQVACLAFYLTHFKDTQLFKTKEISAMNTNAGGTRIGNPSQAVEDATQKNGYLAPAGGGKKQLTGYGEDVVNALPDQEAVKAVAASAARKQRTPRKKPKKT
jgi:hypothetical protein